MKHKMNILLLVLALFISGSGSAFGISYFGYDEFGGTWHDADKDWDGDRLLCWAAVASNILDWGGWGVSDYNTESSIFDNYEDHWTDRPGLPIYAFWWWFYGEDISSDFPWEPSVDVAGGGNYFSDCNFYDYYHEYWENDTMSAIDDYLHAGYGVNMTIYSFTGGHALTAWGFEYDENGDYIGVYVTDSDDNRWGASGLQYYSVSWNDSYDRWDIGDGMYSGWHIGGVMALGRNTIPEPGTIILVSFGLLGLAWLRLKYM
ncbi:MAG: PEP-CTERM sorting domain-containing protein [Desulfobacteraceae bacterium]|nr:PEP-CTERM sorting domain-containing protein [Desulfobacteraceae bacterium]